MLKKFTTGEWSMRHDRQLIMLAKTHTLEDLAKKFDRPVTTIVRRAEQLGLSIRGKAKGKCK
jgi:hypothetical protein